MNFQLYLGDETVEQAFPAEPCCVSPETTVREVFQLMKEHRRGYTLICEDEQLVGIFTERDALGLMAAGCDFELAVERVMVRDPITVTRGDSVGLAITKMAVGGYRQLPIVDQSRRPTGVISTTGILHYLVQHFPNIVYTLPPKPHHTTHEREGA